MPGIHRRSADRVQVTSLTAGAALENSVSMNRYTSHLLIVFAVSLAVSAILLNFAGDSARGQSDDDGPRDHDPTCQHPAYDPYCPPTEVPTEEPTEEPTVPALDRPPPPSGLRASVSGTSSFSFTWNTLNGASNYEYQLSIGGYVEETGQTTGTGKVFLLSKGFIICGTTYTFRVRAYGNGSTYATSWGSWASTSITTDSCIVPPPAPSNPTASQSGSSSFSFTWSTLSGASKYEYEYSIAGGAYVGTTETTSSGATIRPTKGAIICGLTYRFKVRAYGNGSTYAADWGSSASTTYRCTLDPTVTISANKPMIDEGESITFTVSASPTPSSNLTVSVSVTEDGSFLTGSWPPSVTLTSSDSSESFTVMTVNDEQDERHGSVTGSISPGTGYELGTASVTVPVRDDDPTPPDPTVTISANKPMIDEGESITFTVSASPAPSSNLTVSVSVTEDGSFLTGSWPPSVTLTSSDSSESFTVMTVNDEQDERHGSVTGSISPGTGYELGTASVTVPVRDDDPTPPDPTVTISANKPMIDEGESITFTVSASPAPSSNLTVSVSVTEDGSFLTGSWPPSVTLTSSDSSESFTVMTVNDEQDERHGSVTGSISPGTGYELGTASVTVPVRDDDPTPPDPTDPTVTISANKPMIDEGESITFTVSASPAPSSNLTVSVSVTEDGSFLTGSWPPSVTLTSSDSSESFTVMTVNDGQDERHGSVTGSISPGTGYELGTASVTVPVWDDDPTPPDPTDPTVTISAHPTSVDEGESIEFTVSASPTPSSNLTVSVSVTEDGSFLTGSWPPSVTLTSSDSSESFTVMTVNDEQDERHGSVTGSISPGTGYELGTASVTVPVRDDDPTPPVIILAITVSGDSTKSYTENDTAMVASYTASNTGGNTVTWSLDGDDNDDFTIVGGNLRFKNSPDYESPTDSNGDNVYKVTVRASAASRRTGTRAVTVTVTNAEEPGSVTFSHASPQVGVEITATLDDPDGGMRNITWNFQRSTHGVTWDSIFDVTTDAAAITYTPVPDDGGKLLRVSVLYKDAEDPPDAGPNKTAVSSPLTVKLKTPVLDLTPLPERKAALTWTKKQNANQYVLEFRSIGGAWSPYLLMGIGRSAENLAVEIELDDILGTGQGLGDSPFAYQFQLKARLNHGIDTPGDSDFSEAIIVIDTPITVADGDSRTAPGGLGQADLEKNSIQGTLGSSYTGGTFSYRYRKLVGFHATANWQPKTEFSRNQAFVFDADRLSETFEPDEAEHATVEPITGLELEKIYAIQLIYEGTSQQNRVYAGRDVYVWPSKRSAGIGPQRPNGERVGSYPLNYPMQNTTYSYRICEDTFPDGTMANGQDRLEAWRDLVIYSLDQWETATEDLVTLDPELDGTGASLPCTNYSVYIDDLWNEINTNPQYADRPLNEGHRRSLANFLAGLNGFTNLRATEQGDLNEIKMFELTGIHKNLDDAGAFPELSIYVGLADCIFDDEVRGCANPYHGDDQYVATTDILLNKSKLTEDTIDPPALLGGDKNADRTDAPFNKCPTSIDYRAQAVLVHEAGHALGIKRLNAKDADSDYARGHPFNLSPNSTDTVMSNILAHEVRNQSNTLLSVEIGPRCFPHPFDILAIYALYQTR